MRSQSNGFNTQKKIQPQEALIRRSLNRDSRRRELIKITLENQQLLKRLAEKQSAYSVGKWEEDYMKKEKLMKEVMCEYPFVLDQTPNIDNTF
jgi:hypothetical protein